MLGLLRFRNGEKNFLKIGGILGVIITIYMKGLLVYIVYKKKYIKKKSIKDLEEEKTYTNKKTQDGFKSLLL